MDQTKLLFALCDARSVTTGHARKKLDALIRTLKAAQKPVADCEGWRLYQVRGSAWWGQT